MACPASLGGNSLKPLERISSSSSCPTGRKRTFVCGFTWRLYSQARKTLASPFASRSFADRFLASLFLLLSGGPIHGGSVAVYQLRAAVRANRQKHREHGQSQQHQFAQLRREILPRKKRKHA